MLFVFLLIRHLIMKPTVFCILAATTFLFLACEGGKSKQTNTVAPEINSPTVELADKPSDADDSKLETTQTVEERIADIKRWYGEIQRLKLKNCTTKKRTKYDSFSPESEAIPFDQEASVCKINDEYEVITGTFYGYESGSIVRIYKRNGNIFFALLEGGGEGFTQETRLYCGTNEQVILHMQREADNGDAPSGAHQTIPVNEKNPALRSYLKEEIKEIEWILGSKI
ncbi:MAG: hypothetical protein RL432_768 [Bacteroidota bacterium]|jgi:hypothetical protein